MVRTLLISFSISLVLMGVAPAADDEVDSSAVAETEFARCEFPVPEQPTFDADLQLLERVLIAKVESPAPKDYTHDRVHGHELAAVLELMAQWPNSKFGDSLSRHFRTSDWFVIECAQALVAQRDQELIPVVETRKAYERHYSVGCFGGLETVAGI